MSHFNLKVSSVGELNALGYHLYNPEKPLTSRLAEQLKQKGLSPNDLARLTGISKQSISLVINNQAVPNTEFTMKVATVLDVSVFDLFDLEPHAWCAIAKEKDKTLYFDNLEFTIVDSSVKQATEQNTVQWIQLPDKTILTFKDTDPKPTLSKTMRPRFEKLVTPVTPTALPKAN